MQKKNLTSLDVARIAGVSQSTVSRVLRNQPTVTSKTRAHVLKIIEEQAYLPNAAARSMKTNRSGSIAVVVANLTNPLYPMLLQLLVDCLARHGLRTTVWEVPRDLNASFAAAINESSNDGIIFATANDSAMPFFEAIASKKPVILMNRCLSSNAFDAVISDNRAGGQAAAAYLLAAKRKKIGLISAQSEASTIKEREQGFLAELRKHGKKVSCTRSPYEFQAFNYENGYLAAQQLLELEPDIDSIFCTNDIIAIGALDGARAGGKRIPDDIWIIGYDDIPMAGWDSISLTTVHQPVADMTALVVERLRSRIARPELPPLIARLPNRLVVRRSTAFK
jgi:LacI family transcriptional regulator